MIYSLGRDYLTYAATVPAQYPEHRVTAPVHAGGLSDGLLTYVYPERVSDPLLGSNPDGSTPGALQGDDYPLTYDANGYPELPACLARASVTIPTAEAA